MKKEKAFSLLELIIVIIIVGVLATLGFVNYGSVKERTLDKEAQANLKLIRAAERIYRMEYGFYANAGNAATVNSILKLAIPTGTPNWNYAVTGASTNAFSSRAQRNVTTGTPRAWCIDQASETATSCP